MNNFLNIFVWEMLKNLKEREHFRDFDIDVRVILKLIVKKYGGRFGLD
jgi:hypothetical protein